MNTLDRKTLRDQAAAERKVFEQDLRADMQTLLVKIEKATNDVVYLDAEPAYINMLRVNAMAYLQAVPKAD